MLRLSKLADYAVVVLVRLSEEGCNETPSTAPAIAGLTGLPEPTVAKVLKALTVAGLVRSQRGARGGYLLARPLAGIGVIDVVEAIDGPVALTACVEGATSECLSEALCPVRGRWDPVNRAVLEALGRISLADMIANPARPHARASAPRPSVSA